VKLELPNMKNETLGQRALARRKELKLTQRDVAKAAGVAHVTISQWERDETTPSGKRLFSLSQALHCPPAWLLYGEGEALPPAASEIKKRPELEGRLQELVDLFESLPLSEQEAQLNELRARVENNNRLFEELLQARKRQKNLKNPL
jgi:transcriptional regulator with XRE-family HTH domain